MSQRGIKDIGPNCTDQKIRSRVLNIKNRSVIRLLIDEKSYLVYTVDAGRLRVPAYRVLKREFDKVGWPVPPHLNIFDFREWVYPALKNAPLNKQRGRYMYNG